MFEQYYSVFALKLVGRVLGYGVLFNVKPGRVGSGYKNSGRWDIVALAFREIELFAYCGKLVLLNYGPHLAVCVKGWVR